jgi:hypothetical protein
MRPTRIKPAAHGRRLAAFVLAAAAALTLAHPCPASPAGDGRGPAGPAKKAERRFALREDPRLGTEVRVVGKRLTLEQILDALRRQTGLTLTVDPSLSGHGPVFESVQMCKARAWAVLEMVARTQLDGGEWVPAPGGYRLTGKRGLPAGPPAARSRPAPPPARFPLRADPKLKARVHVRETDPPVQELLRRMREATQLSIDLDPGLADHDPELGTCQWGEVPAWSAMEFLAGKGLEGGEWVRTDTGYVLRGTSTARHAGPSATYWLSLVTVLLSLAALVALAAGGMRARRLAAGLGPLPDGPAAAASPAPDQAHR